jgi:hypothetical protein
MPPDAIVRHRRNVDLEHCGQDLKREQGKSMVSEALTAHLLPIIPHFSIFRRRDTRRVPRHCSIEPPGCPPQPTAPFQARNRDR